MTMNSFSRISLLWELNPSDLELSTLATLHYMDKTIFHLKIGCINAFIFPYKERALAHKMAVEVSLFVVCIQFIILSQSHPSLRKLAS